MAGSRPPVAIPAAPLVGRAAEVDAASRFLADGFASFEPRAVVVRGDPGIGKTAVWRHLVESVGGDGTRVLAAAPTSAESELAYAGLADLIEAVPDDLIEALPGPQRHGLGVATLREEAGVEPLDPRTIGTAILGLVRTLASRSAVLIAIDDRQWLDRASADALVFALRRIVREPVAVLLSIRTDQDGAAVEDDDVTGLFGPDRTLQLEIGPLTAGALFQLLRNRLGHAFPRPTLIRIANWSGGNALLAIELGRLGLQPGGLIGAEAPSGLPRTVTAAVTRRLSSLPAEERRSVLLAALAPELTATELGEAAGGLGWPWTLP
ncbi:MAG TPA: ATP-binding protein, partial [Candidatus Limnocylindrales bacterium]|nr:ATP-binding protein [Candidatus Limnocylindrales bacterium]